MSGTHAYSESEVVAIGQWLREGLSSSKIAGLLTQARGGQRVSRNAVVGVVHRNPELRMVGFANLPGGGFRKGRTSAKPRMKAPPKPVVIKPKLRPSTAPVYEKNAYDRESLHLPLAALGWRDCRWAVNEAAEGEEHLFCGAAAAEGSRYCNHHASRAIR